PAGSATASPNPRSSASCGPAPIRLRRWLRPPCRDARTRNLVTQSRDRPNARTAGDKLPNPGRSNFFANRSQDRSNLLLEGLSVEWFDDIAVGPGLPRGDDVLARGLRGQHDDGQPLEIGFCTNVLQQHRSEEHT